MRYRFRNGYPNSVVFSLEVFVVPLMITQKTVYPILIESLEQGGVNKIQEIIILLTGSIHQKGWTKGF